MVGWSSGKTYLFHGYNVGSIPAPTTLPEMAESPNTYFPQGVLITRHSQLLLACSSVVERSAVNRLVVGSIPNFGNSIDKASKGIWKCYIGSIPILGVSVVQVHISEAVGSPRLGRSCSNPCRKIKTLV